MMTPSTYRLARAALGIAILLWCGFLIAAILTGHTKLADNMMQLGLVVAAGALMIDSWRHHRWLFLAIALSALLALFVPAAHAQATSVPMDAWMSRTDSSNDLITKIIGDPGGLGLFGGGTGNAVFGQMLSVFNVAVMGVASVFFMWNVMSASISGAHDGEFLGKANHSAWVPIRTVIGASAMIPAFAGWNLAQLVMAWATAVGIGIAGAVTMWSSNIIQGIVNTDYSVPAPLPAAGDIMPAWAKATANLANIKRDFEQMKAAGSEDVDVINITWGVTAQRSGDTLRFAFGATPPSGGYAEDAAGTVSITLPPVAAVDDARARTIVKAVADATEACVGPFNDNYTQPILSATSLPEEAIRARTDAITQSLASAGLAFNSCIKSRVTGSVANLNNMVATVVSHSNWIEAGYRGINAIKSNTLAFTASSVKVNSVTSNQIEVADKPGVFDVAFVKAISVVGLMGDCFACQQGTMKEAMDTSLSQAWSNSLDGLTSKITDFMLERARSFAGWMAGQIQALNGNPITQLQSLGVGVIDWVATILTGFFVLTGSVMLIAAALSKLPGADAISSAVGAMILPGFLTLLAMLAPLFFFGIKMAGYIPFIPAIIWTMAILNWIVIVIESMFGSTLWALAHLDMDGEGMGQRTTHGYMFLLNLLFRPTIMVITVSLAYVIMSVVAGLFNGYVSDAVISFARTSGSWIAIFALSAAALWVVVAFMEMLITHSMNLVFVIPNQVFAWIGGQFGSDIGASGATEAAHSAKGGIDAAGHGAQSSGQAAMGGFRGMQKSGAAARKRLAEKKRKMENSVEESDGNGRN